MAGSPAVPPCEVGGSAPSTRPRVLLSIVKSACFERFEGTGDHLYSAISAGFGRFQCERLLKPSGVELMNLPRSANIEISVFRRAAGEGAPPSQVLYHGLICISQVYPFLTMGTENSVPSPAENQAQIWESWLGLLSADVNLKSQNPERLFQRCQEMGTSTARFPRLLVRLQYLAPGVVVSPQQRMPSVAGNLQFRGGHYGPQNIPQSRPVSIENSIVGRLVSSPRGACCSGDFALVRTAAIPEEDHASHRRTERSCGSGDFAFVRTAAIAEEDVPAGHPTITPTTCSGESGIGSLATTGRTLLTDASVTSGRKAMEELRGRIAALEFAKTSLQSQEAARDAAEFAFFAKVTPALNQFGCNVDYVTANPIATEVCFDQVAKCLEDVASLVEAEGCDSDGGVLRIIQRTPTRADLRNRVQELEAQLAEAEEERHHLLTSQQDDGFALVSFAEEALAKALRSGEAALDEWLLDADSRYGKPSLLKRADRFVAGCREAATLRSAFSRPKGAADGCMFFYKPVRSDPIDCMLAASLLRLSAQEGKSTVETGFHRLRPGLYRYGGADGPRLRCGIDQGQLVLRCSSACNGQEGACEEWADDALLRKDTSRPVMGLQEFLECQAALHAFPT